MNPGKALASFWICCAMYGVTHAQDTHANSAFRFRHYGTKDGLYSQNSQAIIQDSLGFIWTQHFGGLSRFDGYNFKVYRYDPDDSLTSPLNFVLGFINPRPDGNVWIPQYQPVEGIDILAKFDRKIDGFVNYRIQIPDLHRSVSRICIKDGEIIWVSTRGDGLYSYNLQTKEAAHYLNGDSTQRSFANKNTIHTLRDEGDSLVLTTREGIWSFDKRTKKFERPPCNPKDSLLLYHSVIYPVSKSKKTTGNYWINAGNGSFILTGPDFSEIQRVTYTGPFSSAYSMDSEDVFWFGTQRQGLFRLDPRDSSLINIRHVPDDPYSLSSDNVNDVLADRDQNIWVTTDKGVDVLRRTKLQFHNYNAHETQLGANTVIEVNNSEQLVMVSGTDLLMAPLTSDNKSELEFKKKFSVNSPALRIWRGKNFFWIRERQGVTGYPLDSSGKPTEPHLKVLDYDRNDKNKLMAFSLMAPLWEDKAGNLWVGSNTSGLSRVSATVPYGTTGSVITFKKDEKDPSSLGGNRIVSIVPETDSAFWVVTTTSVDIVTVRDFVKPDLHIEHILTGREIPFVVYKALDGRYFLGTSNGLYEGSRENGKVRFNLNPLWNKSSVRAIQEDEYGRLWLYGNGPVLYDRKENVAIEFNSLDGVDHGYGPEANMMHRTRDGKIIVFDFSGYTMFDPSTITISDKPVFPVFTKLLVNNISISGRRKTGDDEFAANADITVLNELSLDFRHNNFTMEFSAMEMTAPERNRYRYKLEGYDRDWIETDWTNRSATYTNLDAGDYTFKITASNHHGVWSDIERSLAIHITPPPWKTWWAYSLYGSAFVSILLYWRNYESKRLILKHRAEHLTELDHLKSQFFANISHEFRTPITLILGPLTEMYNETFKGDQKPVVASMIRNGQRLLRLINQLLDLSKIESGKMELHCSPIDLVAMLREVIASYESLATSKKIKYFFYAEVEELSAFVDQDKIEKVIHNLLSNAFKFSKEGGEIIVNLKTEPKRAVIIVKDSGIGIPQDQLDKVFDRFYQVDNSQTREYEGTGIGMALAKELIELHEGIITVESQEGKGTTFRISLPLKLNRVKKVKPGPTEVKTTTAQENIGEESDQKIGEAEFLDSDKSPLLLVVEDNTELRRYINKILSSHYQIVEAANGKEGVRKAEEIIPDLIISDIMMPQMDGYELCKRIKNNESTSHIPVILLTAKADHESRLSGLEIGADDYLSKPFDTAELKLIVRNRIEERTNMRERFSRQITLEPKHISVSSLDEKFLAKVMAIIEEHMDDENLSIDALSREVGYSNIHFYRKIKALTDQTPSTFLRTIRLKRAAEMLSVKSDNVTQIAYSVGFTSLSYFNKCFKEQFGMTPGQFADKAK